MLAVDYLNRVPVVGLTGMLGEEGRSGEAAAALRALARHHGWAVIAAAALKSENFKDGDDLSALLGDERVPYEADRVLLVQRSEEVWDCGCAPSGSAHAQRPHWSRPALADPVLGRALLSRPGIRISPPQGNCLMDATLSTLVLFLREAWTALAGALLAFAVLAGMAQILRLGSASVIGANLWVWEAISAVLSVVILALFAFLGVPQIVSALEFALPSGGGCGPINELGKFAAGLIGALAALRMLKAVFASVVSASLGASSVSIPFAGRDRRSGLRDAAGRGSRSPGSLVPGHLWLTLFH